MKIVKSNTGKSKIVITKKEWLDIGTQNGWMKVVATERKLHAAETKDAIVKENIKTERKAQIVPEEGITDGDVDKMQGMMEFDKDIPINPVENEEKYSYSYGTTPEEVIDKKVQEQTPNGYPMTIKNKEEWREIAKAVNQGIDSYLQAFTQSKFDNRTGEITIHPTEMKTLLRRLYEGGSEVGMGLRMDILQTLDIEEI